MVTHKLVVHGTVVASGKVHHLEFATWRSPTQNSTRYIRRIAT